MDASLALQLKRTRSTRSYLAGSSKLSATRRERILSVKSHRSGSDLLTVWAVGLRSAVGPAPQLDDAGFTLAGSQQMSAVSAERELRELSVPVRLVDAPDGMRELAAGGNGSVELEARQLACESRLP